MGVISQNGIDYPVPSVPVQSDGSATDLTNAAVPTGQTIKSYLNSNLSNKLTVIYGYHNVLTIRNLNLTYTNGEATYDASDKIGATNEVIGIATYPYNRQIPSSITSNNGVLKIANDSQSLNGAYYTNIIIFVF